MLGASIGHGDRGESKTGAIVSGSSDRIAPATSGPLTPAGFAAEALGEKDAMKKTPDNGRCSHRGRTTSGRPSLALAWLQEAPFEMPGRTGAP
jgi:hypothetical protein